MYRVYVPFLQLCDWIAAIKGIECIKIFSDIENVINDERKHDAESSFCVIPRVITVSLSDEASVYIS